MAGPMAGAAESRTDQAGLTAPVHPGLARCPAHVDGHQRLARAPLYKLPDDVVAPYGARPCTHFLGRTLTYREAGTRVERTAAGLQAPGSRKGTRVQLLLLHCPTFVVYYFTVLKTGGAVINDNLLYAHEELTVQVCVSETSFMVTLALVTPFSKVAFHRHLAGKVSKIEVQAAIELCETLAKTTGLNAEEEARRERK